MIATTGPLFDCQKQQITDYRTEAESRGYKPVKAFLIGNGLGNLGLKEAFAASVTPLNVDLTTIDAVKPTGDFVT
ncbi:MAG TPA: hypothetical protein P5282_09060, partial [Anaerolineaceae bacterium]|nr:hypothetical protein [Anaerolineaceae bacterium]